MSFVRPRGIVSYCLQAMKAMKAMKAGIVLGACTLKASNPENTSGFLPAPLREARVMILVTRFRKY